MSATLQRSAAAGSGVSHTIAAPVGGWNTRDPIATMEPTYGRIHDNTVVEGGDVRVRRGWRAWATGLPGRVDGLMPYTGAGATETIFAASGSGLYDVSAAGAVGSAAVTGLASARWDGINFAASGGNYLLAWNGTDTERTWNGSTWASWSPTGLTGRVVWAGAFKGRMLVGTSGRLSFYYGGAAAIAGSFTEFPLQGVARRGGSVVAFATLSGDNGDGPDDLAVFITSEGEAIVYAGTDPSSSSTWALVGRWELPRPIGSPHRCVTRYGGDALYMCDLGVVPLSAFRSGGDAATVLEKSALTRRIEPTWRTLANERRSSSGWGITTLTRLGLVVINVPWSATTAQQIVISEGGAVTRWGGVPGAVWSEGMGGRVFVGDSSATGRTLLYGEDTQDAAKGVRWEVLSHFNALRSAGRLKQALRVQPVLRDASGVTLDVNVVRDWEVPTAVMDSLGASATAPAVPPLPGGGSYLIWDSGSWDVGLWGGGEGGVSMPWRGATGMGQAFAVRLRGVSGNGRPAWLGSNLIVQNGGPTR